jgi:hypothetical protein
VALETIVFAAIFSKIASAALYRRWVDIANILTKFLPRNVVISGAGFWKTAPAADGHGFQLCDV